MSDDDDLGHIEFLDRNSAYDYRTEEPTGYLRWLGAVLQTEWKIVDSKDGRVRSVQHEWRDVPVVGE